MDTRPHPAENALPIINPENPAGPNGTADGTPVSTPANPSPAGNPNSANLTNLAPADLPKSGDQASDLTSATISEQQITLALRRVKDPDLQLNIVDLGLVYASRVDGDTVTVDMTLTSPGCPSGPEIIGDIEREVKVIPGVGNVTVNLVWTPFWTPDRIEPRVRAYLGL